MAAGLNNGDYIADGGASVDSFFQAKQNGTIKTTFGYQNSSSSAKLSFGALGTSDTVIFDATGGKYKGYGANTAPAAGFIGEQIRSAIGSGSAVSVSSATGTNITSISLTAGIWDVSGLILFTGPTTSQQIAISISTVSATQGTSGDNQNSLPITAINALNAGISLPSYRLSLSGTTTVYLVAVCVFTVGTCTAFGRISATRVA